MDEPLSNLDARLRVQMRAEIARIQRMTGVTTIYVTHDQVEAMTMGDRVAVMNRGVLQQVGAPRTLYHEPANLFVASFIGSPSINLIEGKLVGSESGPELALGAERIRLPEALLNRKPAIAGYIGRTVAVGLRPETLTVGPAEGRAAGRDRRHGRLHRGSRGVAARPFRRRRAAAAARRDRRGADRSRPSSSDREPRAGSGRRLRLGA